MSIADHDAGTGEWAHIPLRARLVQDLQHAVRAAEQHIHELAGDARDAGQAPKLLRDLGYLAGLLGWHLHKHRTEATGTTTSLKESSR